jgi:hypothetical protein
MEQMLANEVDMRTTLIGLSSKLQSAGSRLNGARVIDHRIKYLELQERCETLLEDVSREFGSAERHIKDVDNLEQSVTFWLARLENGDL